MKTVKSCESFKPLSMVKLAMVATSLLVSMGGLGAVHCGGVHHLHRAVRAVFRAAAGIQKSQRHRRESGGPGHRPGHRHGPPRRCRRAVCARQGGRRKSGGRGLCRQAHRGDVQRLCAGRPGQRSAQGQGQRRGRSAQEDFGRQRPVHLARRQERHPRRRVAVLEDGRPGGQEGQRLQVLRLRHGPGAQHGLQHQRLRADRPRHLAQLQEPGRPESAGRG